VICPSVWPFDQGEVIAAATAALSLRTPLANDATRLVFARSSHGSECVREALAHHGLEGGDNLARLDQQRSTGLDSCDHDADSDESSWRFQLKPATCSDGSQPVIPTKPAGMVERTVGEGMGSACGDLVKFGRSLWHAAFAVTRLSVPAGERCEPAGRARHRRWWDHRCAHASYRPAAGW
jgi:hypothetical protein